MYESSLDIQNLFAFRNSLENSFFIWKVILANRTRKENISFASVSIYPNFVNKMRMPIFRSKLLQYTSKTGCSKPQITSSKSRKEKIPVLVNILLFAAEITGWCYKELMDKEVQNSVAWINVTSQVCKGGCNFDKNQEFFASINF